MTQEQIAKIRQEQIDEIQAQIWNMECMQAYDKVEYDKLVAKDEPKKLTADIALRDTERRMILASIEELKKSKKTADRMEVKKLEVKVQSLQWEIDKINILKRGVTDLLAKHNNEAVARAERIGRLKDMLLFTRNFQQGELWNPDFILKEGTKFQKEDGRIKLDKLGQNVLYVESNDSGATKD